MTTWFARVREAIGARFGASSGTLLEPIRSPTFDAARFHEHGVSLAQSRHSEHTGRAGASFYPRVRSNQQALLSAYRWMVRESTRGATLAQDAQWILENFHLIDEQVRGITRDLPPSFYRQLPKLTDGPLAGLPRIYEIAWTFVAHTDSHFNADMLASFLDGYQSVTPLTIGELWALPASIRAMLLENLRRLVERLISAQVARDYADALFERVKGRRRPEVEFGAALDGLQRRLLRQAFLAQFIQRLRAASLDDAVAPDWFEAGIDPDLDLHAVLRDEQARQAASQLIAANTVRSMRNIARFDWNVFVEAHSHLHRHLAFAPGYLDSDFRTRDSYRHTVERLARRSRRDEVEIASMVARMTLAAAAHPAADARRSNVGNVLDGDGRDALERELFGHPARLRSWLRNAAPALYLSLLVGGAFAIDVVGVRQIAPSGSGIGLRVVLGLLALLPALRLSQTLLNRVIAAIVTPRRLPRRLFVREIPPDCKTLVVVPALLLDQRSAFELAGQIELHYLSNPEPNARFALLTDFGDSPTPEQPGEKRVLTALATRLRELNDSHGRCDDGEARFLLLHRVRRWNEAQGCWMGWERKRGKLEELNKALLGENNAFVMLDGDLGRIPVGVRYVLTLDADTRVPPGALRRLVSTASHPMNAPVFDEVTRRVRAGYAILQPRVTFSLPEPHEATGFRALFAGVTGIDPYAGVSSDTYQDIAGSGTFWGKGLYDVYAFHHALSWRIPPDTLLSHDLIESGIARCAYVSDVELVEDYPAHSEVDAARTHRWTRGDWQLLPWIVGAREAPLRLIERWKTIDNLLRSLTAPAAVALLVLGWVNGDASGWRAGAFVVLTLATFALLDAAFGLRPRGDAQAWLPRMRVIGATLGRQVLVGLWTLTQLARQAVLMTDAIGRTLLRLSRRRNLLEWTTAAQETRRATGALSHFLRRYSVSLLLVASIAAVLALVPGAGWRSAVLWLFGWSIAPLLAWRASRLRTSAPTRRVTAGHAAALRRVARRTWLFFDRFVGSDDNHLPPDNVQLDPEFVVAHRTSPTNIGMYVLAVACARRFGFIGSAEMIARLDSTLATLLSMPKHQGHLYNWYDSRTLAVLSPRYVSSVDSGNLCAHLLAVAQASERLASQSLFGVADADTAAEQRALLGEVITTLPADCADVAAALQAIDERCCRGPGLLEAMPCVAESIEAAQAAIREARARPKYAREGDPLALAAEYVRLFASRLDDWRTFLSPLHEAATLCRGVADQPALVQAAELADVPADDTTLRSLRARYEMLLAAIDAVTPPTPSLERARGIAAAGRDALVSLIDDSARCGATARVLALSMDFGFLYDRRTHLFAIGYRVDDSTLDESRYDLLASEARLASYVAIAKGDVPVKHWFRLGRALLPSGSEAVLRSWSGSMFEYLMPSLVLDTPLGSLLEQTCRRAIVEQRRYAAAREVPWGISESAYNARDRELTFQYSSFGVPTIAIKRGLEDDLVIAPYATGLAALYDASAAVENFAALERLGALSRFGFCEAIDFTPDRVPDESTFARVQCYMAHHQGMLLVALCSAACNRTPQRWFHSEPCVRAVEPLLQERSPDRVPARSEDAQRASELPAEAPTPLEPRRYRGAVDELGPITHLLSNGRLYSMIGAGGSGYLRWRHLAITRWRDDATRDDYGNYLYVRDRGDGSLWSLTQQPCGRGSGEVELFEDRARFVRRVDGIESQLEVFVCPEDDVELRRVRLFNRRNVDIELDLTSYAEIVLAPHAADEAHPAFSNLFVESIADADRHALLFRRRSRSENDDYPWVAHFATGQVGDAAFDFETDRLRFIGRERTVHRPAACGPHAQLSRSSGCVLDPVASLRVPLRIAPGQSIELSFATAVAPDHATLLELIDKYRYPEVLARASQMSWTYAQVQLRQLALGPRRANVLQTMARHLVYTLPRRGERVNRDLVERDHLWRFGISGERALVLAQVVTDAGLATIRDLMRAREYWRHKGVSVDIAILHHEPPSYHQPLHSVLEGFAFVPGTTDGGVPSEIFVIHAHQLDPRHLAALKTFARLVIQADGTELREMFGPVSALPERRIVARRMRRPPPTATGAPKPPVLFNGLGGFSADGSEYCIRLPTGSSTPLPWINVIAGPRFGCQVSASGSGFTWSQNSRERQLTPWSNDAVSDPPAEAIYLRDLVSDELWSPTVQPHRHPGADYSVRHGFGYSVFECEAPSVSSRLTVFVARDDSVRRSLLELRNRSGVARQVKVTFYAEWRLGPGRASSRFVATEYDAANGTVYAVNEVADEFAGRVAFATMMPTADSWTCDRAGFLGPLGRLRHPAALKSGAALARASGRGLDPCVALQKIVTLAPGASVQLSFALGDADVRPAARARAARCCADRPADALADVQGYWKDMLGELRVQTPEPSFDLLVNGRLLYQVIACRLWSRAAFYQLGGAYGFRDQLQDVLALLQTRPAFARAQLVRAAGRQFREGDVQHWWHPPSGRGVRTRISDDLLWLPYVTSRYIAVSDDWAVLDEQAPFLDGELLPDGVEDRYFTPAESLDGADLYEHCRRAIEARLDVGAHGLPPIGSGDWNDGMNRVGLHGTGESVWLAWFLVAVLAEFAPIAQRRGDDTSARRWLEHRQNLLVAIEANGWDGAWYRRGYFDDGTPLGSASQPECKIDLIAQAWSVLSGGGRRDRATQALASADAHLVDRDARLVRLLAPSFDHAQPHPGYIRGYPPGVRENGGQYSHAAVWHAMAHARLGHGDNAFELLQMVNPIARSATPAEVALYKTEPYALAGDIYAVAPHVGRGGWSWYTGSAAWFHVAATQEILGLQIRGDRLRMDPCIPRGWPGFTLELRRGAARYRIEVVNPDGVSRGVTLLTQDGAPVDPAQGVLLVDSGEHRITVTLGAASDVGTPAVSARDQRVG